MAKCLEDLDAFLKQAIDIGAYDLQKLSASELAKILSNNPAVPEKGIWGWITKKQDLLDVFQDLDAPDAIKGHVIKAFESKLDILKGRATKELGLHGQTAKYNSLLKEIAKADKDLQAAKVKYFVEPPPPPLFSEWTAAKLNDLSNPELYKLLWDHPDIPEGNIYAWMPKKDLVDSILSLGKDSSLANKNAVLLKAYKARVDTLDKRLKKALAAGDQKKANKLQNELSSAYASHQAKVQELGVSPLQAPHSAPVTMPADVPLLVGVDDEIQTVFYPNDVLPEDMFNIYQKYPQSEGWKHSEYAGLTKSQMSDVTPSTGSIVDISGDAPIIVKFNQAYEDMLGGIEQFDTPVSLPWHATKMNTATGKQTVMYPQGLTTPEGIAELQAAYPGAVLKDFVTDFPKMKSQLEGLGWDIHAPGAPSAAVSPDAVALESFKTKAFNMYDAWGNSSTAAKAEEWAVKIEDHGLPHPTTFDGIDEVDAYLEQLHAIPTQPSKFIPAAPVDDLPSWYVYSSPDNLKPRVYHLPDATPSQIAALEKKFPGYEVKPVTISKDVFESNAGVDGVTGTSVNGMWTKVETVGPPQPPGRLAIHAVNEEIHKVSFPESLPAQQIADIKAAYPGYAFHMNATPVDLFSDAFKDATSWELKGVKQTVEEVKPTGTVPYYDASDTMGQIYIPGDLTDAEIEKVIDSLPADLKDQYDNAELGLVPLDGEYVDEIVPKHQFVDWAKGDQGLGAPPASGKLKFTGPQIQTASDVTPPALAPPPITPAGQQALDALEASASNASDVPWFSPKWNTLFQEAGFPNASQAGSMFYKLAKKKGINGGKASGMFTHPDYKALQDDFVEAVAKKDAGFLKDLDGLEGKVNLDNGTVPVYSLPEKFAVAPAPADPWATVGEVKTAKIITGDDFASDFIEPGAPPPAPPAPQVIEETVDVPVNFKVDVVHLHGEIHHKQYLTVAQKKALAEKYGPGVEPKDFKWIGKGNELPLQGLSGKMEGTYYKKTKVQKTVYPDPAPTPPPIPAPQVTDWALPTLRQAPQSPLIAGGAHAKETFVDEFGNEWMGKPVSKGGWAAQGGAPDTAFLAKGEDAGHQILHRIGLKVAPSHVMEMNGKTYHVQKLFSDIKRNGLSGVRPADLSLAQREQLMQHQVGDWLIGNHDSHEGNFLILGDDTMVSIDKGQFMKFLGRDKLDTSYKPPGNFGTPFYHGFWKDYEAGKFDVDLHAIDETLDRIDAMSDSEFESFVRPYARGRAKAKNLPSSMAYMDEDQLVAAALERKHQIRAEFDKFRAARARARGEKFTPSKPKAVPKPKTAKAASGSRIPDAGVPVPVTQALADQVAQAKVHGVPYYVPGSEVEYGQYLFYEEVRGGKRMLVLHGQLLPDGDRIASATLSGVNPQIAALRNQMPPLPAAPQPGDFGKVQSFFEIPEVVHNDIVSAVKTLATHVSDGQYNQATLAKLDDHLKHLKAMIPSGTDTTYVTSLTEAKDYYVKAIEDIQAGVKANTKLTYQIQKQEWVDPDATVKFQKAQVEWEQKNANVLAQRQEIEQRIASMDTTGGLSNAQLTQARVREANVSADLTKVVTHAEKPRLGNGHQYVVNTTDGVEIRYSPYSENGAINWKGHLELSIPTDGSEASLAKITETLDRMGLTSHAATSADMKVTYHEALSAFVKGRQDSSSSPILQAESAARARITKDMSAEQKAGIWEEEMTRVLGPQPADYWKPRLGPVASQAGTQGTEGYWPYWYRPSGDRPVDLKAAFGGKIMTHDVLSYEVSPEDVVNTFRSTGVFGGKAERIRLGVLKETGISEAPDLSKGGGDYVYTRWGQPSAPSRHTQIVISPRAAYRVGTQIHDHDAYGAVSKRNRSWLDIAKVRGGVTEIDVRHGVSLWDDLEVIVASNKAHRDNILKALREGGFPEVVRGVPLAERVVTGAEEARAFIKKHPKSVYSWEGTE